MLPQAPERELLPQLTGRVLVGEHALLPEGLLTRPRGEPPDREDPLGEFIRLNGYGTLASAMLIALANAVFFARINIPIATGTSTTANTWITLPNWSGIIFPSPMN